MARSVIKRPTPKIKYKDLVLESFTTNNKGIYDLRQLVPTGMNNVLFALMLHITSTSASVELCQVYGDGKYFMGYAPNTTYSNVTIRYYYTD